MAILIELKRRGVIHIVTGTVSELGNQLTQLMFEYRYKVFVKKLGWSLDCIPNIERDQFDREDTVYLLALDALGDMIGIARLLNSTKPYLLGNVFAQLLNGLPVPCDKTLWELSRFAAMDLKMLNGVRSQMSHPNAHRLIKACIEVSAQLGAKALLSVSPVGVTRLLKGAGIPVESLGTAKVIEGHALMACKIDCAAACLDVPTPAATHNAVLNSSVMDTHQCIEGSEAHHEDLRVDYRGQWRHR